ncbi:hypothetical protein JTB14_009891 [Gonioctena quinquepunctata]|nr:hypothetical protein JTB14_009891 [Gonioctena quinquepunctata]
MIYTGSPDDSGGKGHTTKVVLNLLEGHLDSGHSVYMDNFYNSFELARQLTTRGTYCTGTLNAKRRNNPKDVIEKKLKKGESISRYSENIMVGKWKNKRDVLYISTEYGGEMVEHIDKKNRNREKPAAILHYNMNMGGVDRQDQLNSYYPWNRKTLRWYKKLGIHYIQMMLLNSFFLHRQFSGCKMSLYEFRNSILCSLLHIQEEGTRWTNTPVRRNESKHVLTKIESKAKDGRINRKRCRACSTKIIRKRTLYHCEKCPDQPGFCVGNCFASAHE